ncbi:MAG: ABC transporter substrate-binding protein [Pseudomonadota bacterium]|nr:ABC transporter substrate-binding protein [Pseudomonadota bacterium]
MDRTCFAPGRRRFVAAAAAASVAAPYVFARRANAAQTLTVRTPGGSFDDIKRKYVYDPFRAKTGIEIVPVAATVAKLLAMFKAGQIEIDCIDTGNDTLLQLERAGALDPIDYAKFKLTDPAEIDAAVKTPYQVGSFVYAFVLGYNKAAFPDGKEPKSWAEFWDLKAFPGPRTLADMASGAPNLEFALLADGVPADKLYPIDIDRAFKSMSRVKPAIAKFWDTGALSAQLMVDKEAVLGALWSTRLQVAMDSSTPLGIQWNQNEILVQSFGITKGTPKADLALQFIDYNLSAEVQSRWMGGPYKAIPTNQKAYPATSRELIDPATNLPWTKSKGFLDDIVWWVDNRTKVNEAWSNWIL